MLVINLNIFLPEILDIIFMKFINEILTAIDIFSTPTNLIYKNDNKVSSNFSKFISILFFTYVSFIFLNSFKI
jgi:hypothetical protein